MINDSRASFAIEFVMFCTDLSCPDQEEEEENNRECEEGDGHFISKCV